MLLLLLLLLPVFSDSSDNPVLYDAEVVGLLFFAIGGRRDAVDVMVDNGGRLIFLDEEDVLSSLTRSLVPFD